MSAATTDRIRRRPVWFVDLDGTLVDSAPVHAAAFQEALAQVAPELRDGFRYQAHAGATTREAAAALTADPDTAARLVTRKQQLYRSQVDAGQVPVFPGARRLLDQLARRGCRAYLVTSGSHGSVQRVLAASGFDGRFHDVLTGDDVPAGKPDPAMYREACRRWGVHPDQVVVVEDSPAGVAAAVGAGLVTLQVHTARPAPGAIGVPDLAELGSLLGSDELR